MNDLNEFLNKGGIIAFPTDTVWGLGALPNSAGVDALFKIKGRPREKHFVIMSDSLAHLRPHMRDFPPLALELAQRYFPGALTVIGNEDPVFGGVRIPKCESFRKLCGNIDGHCLATTSANISGRPALETAAEIERVFPTARIIGDRNFKPSGTASTVVKVVKDQIKILRQGAVAV
ncbi:MAG: Sua5/YciO/YrdC/YwlC family protein [Rickettsiales bacterium]|jgi:L-threonylcarbamoyladenylate synthase|nr:Sua5/YciO/YrdC/YwlC family protein [Rickettsiales bacterium]